MTLFAFSADSLVSAQNPVNYVSAASPARRKAALFLVYERM
jgi:hypothetical protein